MHRLVIIAAWTLFDTVTVHPAAKGYAGGTFDGRYVYFTPSDPSSFVARYDTLAPFDAAASWETFDTTRVSTGALGYYGAAFDGRAVYFAPRNNGMALRFDTGTSRSLPVRQPSFL